MDMRDDLFELVGRGPLCRSSHNSFKKKFIISRLMFFGQKLASQPLPGKCRIKCSKSAVLVIITMLF